MRFMKYLVLSFLLPHAAIGQEDSTFFFDQFTCTINQTIFSENIPVGEAGFGFGIYHTFRKNKIIELPLGFEFNRTSYLQEVIYESKYTTLYNAQFGMNAISVVLTPRISFGKKFKFILEAGVYGDSFARSRRTAHVNYSNYSDTIFKEYDEDKYIHTAPKFGIQAGTGLIIPIKNKAILVKLDYKIFRFYELDYYGHSKLSSNIRLTLGFKL